MAIPVGFRAETAEPQIKLEGFSDGPWYPGDAYGPFPAEGLPPFPRRTTTLRLSSTAPTLSPRLAQPTVRTTISPTLLEPILISQPIVVDGPIVTDPVPTGEWLWCPMTFELVVATEDGRKSLPARQTVWLKTQEPIA